MGNRYLGIHISYTAVYHTAGKTRDGGDGEEELCAGALPCKVSFCVDGYQKEVPKDFHG